MKGRWCQTALQIEDRLHIAAKTSVSLNSEACQALLWQGDGGCDQHSLMITKVIHHLEFYSIFGREGKALNGNW